MAAAIKWDLKQGTWQDTESWIGKELATFTGADEVTQADIRRRLEVLALDCPLHYDEATAREYGYRGVVAPTAMLMSWSMPSYWAPGQPRPELDDPVYLPPYPGVAIPAPGDSMFATYSETEYAEPVYPGDRISGSSRLLSVTRKRLSVGDGAFLVIETTYTKQTGEVVGVEQLTLFRYMAVADEQDAVTA
jgi:acyl dehydratase